MRRLPAVLLLATVIGVVVLDWRLSSAPPTVDFRFGLYLLANLLVSLDLIDLLIRTYFRRRHTVPTHGFKVAPASVPLDVGAFTPYQVRLHLRPWAALLSVHNLGPEVEPLLETLGPLREHLWVIDDASSDDTYERFRRAGVRCLRGSPNRHKPGALRELLGHLPREIVTVIVLDPDARIEDRQEGGMSVLERVLFEFQRSRMAALCPRIGLRPDGWLVTFQQFEYAMSFALGRKSMSDHSITSGIAIYRRDALESVLDEHSLSVYAEDLKNAILLLARGERIYYDGRLYVETEGKRTPRAWFSQRVGWYYGLLKVFSEHLPQLLRLTDRRPMFVYQFLIYIGIFTILLHPFKLVGVGLLTLSAGNAADNALGLGLLPDTRFTEPWYFLLAYLKYLPVAALALLLSRGPGQRLSLVPAIPVYFFYAIAHLVPVSVGYLNWLTLRLFNRRLYRDHYRSEAAFEGDAARRRSA